MPEPAGGRRGKIPNGNEEGEGGTHQASLPLLSPILTAMVSVKWLQFHALSKSHTNSFFCPVLTWNHMAKGVLGKVPASVKKWNKQVVILWKSLNLVVKITNKDKFGGGTS